MFDAGVVRALAFDGRTTLHDVFVYSVRSTSTPADELMNINEIFYNSAGRLRSVWRLLVFALTCFCALTALFRTTEFGLRLVLPRETYRSLFVEGDIGFITQSVLIVIPAALIGWGCSFAFEALPWRALGWALHRGWMSDALKGLLVGAVSIGVAAAIGAAVGGCRLSFPAQPDMLAFARTLLASGFIFMLGAAAEEMLFRGYPLQTLMRSWPVWVALIPTSVPFALVHLENPNVVPGFTMANTVLAGAWLAVAYWRTRSLWFPLGVHWGWNWMQGAVLGSPVSGITKITPDPLVRFADNGPAWIGGGAYGIEGGAACTLALLLSILFIWRTRFVSATPELKRFTDDENPSNHITAFDSSRAVDERRAE
ncbi:MAG TPA: CPBP family intramembrane glutamic endopeptidase [Pyrinomonadaceae bacterium]|nr:CPBP family intramembrane glutamic endopeptidase [Pyrinomonadaceae bacterium]